MSKTLIAVILAGAVIIGGYFFVKSNNPTGDVQNNEVGNTQNGKKVAFSELVKQGGSYKCEVKLLMNGEENGGTIYMSGDNLRSDVSIAIAGKMMDSHFIMRDGYMYTWSSAAPNMGIKIKSDTGVKTDSSVNTGTVAWNSEQVGDYDCAPWVPEQSKFTLPTGMTFTEVNSK